MQDRSAADTLATYSTQVDVSTLPPEVVAKTKLSLLDCLAACVTAETSFEARMAADALAPDRDGASTVIATEARAAADAAAFVNSVSAAATARNDTHTATASHPGMVVVPAVLALSEASGASGARTLESIVVGYEIMCRLGLALITPDVAEVHRPTGLTGPAGASAACAHLLGLRSEARRNAISLASNTAGGLNAWAQAGTNDLVFHSGYAARNGILASALAQRGVVGPKYIFEGKAGLLEAFDARGGAAALVAQLGERYEILSIVHKPAPACIFAQGPSQVAQELVATEQFDPASIESVDVHVSRPAALYPGCDNPGPMERKAAAQMSIQFCVASILATGAIRDANWTNYRDSVTNALAARCRVIADEALTEMFPARNGTRIVVRLRDGRTVTSGQDDFRSMTEEEIVDRFLQYAGDALGRTNAEAILGAILRLETVNDLGPLFRLLRR